ncbi:hypothetical protein [Nostoc sp.]
MPSPQFPYANANASTLTTKMEMGNLSEKVLRWQRYRVIAAAHGEP